MYDVVTQLLDILQVLLSLNIVHNDVKENNICVVTSRKTPPRVTLIDFGMCCNLNGPPLFSRPQPKSERDRRSWVAPEILAGKKGNDVSDLFSFGQIFEWLLTCTMGPTPRVITKWACLARDPRPTYRPKIEVL